MPSTDVSRVTEDHLTLVWKAEEWQGPPATTTDLAARLGVGPSTVSATLKKLARDGLIDYEPYSTPRLTDAGRALAVPVVRRHRLLETYLVARLGYRWDEVHDEADLLEHAVSPLLLERIDAELGSPERDPHGDPIPRADGTVPHIAADRLDGLQAGATGRVARIADREPDVLRHVEAIGLLPGAPVQVEQALDGSGAMRLAVDGRAVTVPAGTAAAVWIGS
jgi:DtxR family transcriptional regulator, Mn-dependent transcriptional regulator